MFNNVSDSVIENIDYVEKCYNTGDVIYDRDDYSRALGYIVEGNVAIEQNNVSLKTAHAGDIFGAASLFNNEQDYVSLIKAASKCVIIFISQATMRDLITQNSTIALNYITFLSERIRYLNNKIAAFTAGTAEERFAKYIIDMHEETKSLEMPGLTYSHLASSLDIGRASLYRVIDSFIGQGMIAKDGRRIIIKDINKIYKTIHKE